MPARKKKKSTRGKLKIGDTWNAITIIALSQNNPLKAIAEFVENCIDAGAKNIVITKGKEKGETYLRICDDGGGVPLDEEGKPNFAYVATHICDSIKRKLKAEGAQGLQGEFGIGLLSFWTVGERLKLTSTGSNGLAYQMTMVKGEPGYEVHPRSRLFSIPETELLIQPLLPGIRSLSGEKIHWYLSEELRDRIRKSGVKIKLLDRVARKSFEVQPRVFEGQPIRQEPVDTSEGELHCELYLNTRTEASRVSLSRFGTRVLPDLSVLEDFQHSPWNSGLLEGNIEASFLRLTPGTRDGVLRDDVYEVFRGALRKIEPDLESRLEEQRRAEEQRASKQVLKTVQRALREALMQLPEEEYDWFDIQRKSKGMVQAKRGESEESAEEDGKAGNEVSAEEAADPPSGGKAVQTKFFEFEGPLGKVTASPASCAVKVESSKNLRAICRDNAGRSVERDLIFTWRIIRGEGRLENSDSEIVRFHAPAEPGLTVIQVGVRQGEISCEAESLVTVADDIMPQNEEGNRNPRKGLPGYTFHRAPGELWRSRYDADKNLVIINNGHRDFVYAAKQKSRRLRYIFRLFSKELVQKNFPGIPPNELLERMIELQLYSEENLR